MNLPFPLLAELLLRKTTELVQPAKNQPANANLKEFRMKKRGPPTSQQ